MFFSFDGIDGTGKSTQMQLFCRWLQELGEDVVACRDPGSTSLGENIRDIVLGHDDQLLIGRRSEMLLYMAARAQLVEEIIEPAIARGATVVSDRYLLANVVYQAYAGGLNVDHVRQVGAVATQGLMPDCVFLLDMAPAAAAARISRDLDRMESQGDHYREQLRSGFLAEAKLDAGHIHVVDATGTVDEVQQAIRTIAKPLL